MAFFVRCCESQHTDRRRRWASIPAWSAWSSQQSGARVPVPVEWACPYGWPIRTGAVRWWNRAACVWCVPATPPKSKQTLRYESDRFYTRDHRDIQSVHDPHVLIFQSCKAGIYNFFGRAKMLHIIFTLCLCVLYVCVDLITRNHHQLSFLQSTQ